MPTSGTRASWRARSNSEGMTAAGRFRRPAAASQTFPIMLFDGFTRRRIDTGEAVINLLTGGGGPPLLLLHGYPQTHACWHRVAPVLARTFTVVAPDLRGYGDSTGPAGDGGLRAYAKRTMAADMVTVMAALGHGRFGVAGHDRGGRVAYR